jgi:glucose-1-phosphate thymidylyltransferase
VVTLDDESRVLDLQEKPLVPNTHNAVPPFYYYVAQDLPLIRECIDQGGATDAPGNLAQYIYRHSVLHAWHMNGGRVDIGNLETYKQVAKNGKELN